MEFITKEVKEFEDGILSLGHTQSLAKPILSSASRAETVECPTTKANLEGENFDSSSDTLIHMLYCFRGLSALWLDATTGVLETVEVEGGDSFANNGRNSNPSYLSIHPNGRVV